MKRTQITSHITIVLTLVTAITAVLIAGFAWLASTKVDDLSLIRQADFVTQGLQQQINAVPREQESVTKWDDAVLYGKMRNHDWLLENIGKWTHDYFGHDRTYVFDDTDHLMFAMRDGIDVLSPSLGDDHDPVARLAAEMRYALKERLQASDPAPIADVASTKVVDIVGRPAVISARPIIPSSERMTVEAGSEFIAIAVKFLDASPIEHIAHYARLDGLHYAPAGKEAGEARIPVISASGATLGHLTWEPIKPGLMLLEQIAPASIIGMFIAMGVVLFLGQGLRRTSLNLIESKAQLLVHRDHLEETVRLRTGEIERQRQELDRLLAQERQVNALQRQFVTMASHEFRTPLAIIDAAAQRLTRTKGELSPQYISEKSGQIRSAVLRMVDLMESILAAGRLETGRISLSLADCNLIDVIASCCARQKEISKEHVFRTNLGELPATMKADRAALEQVFTNLLSNAAKYAPHAPDIHIRGWADERFSYVSVSDQGIGIDTDDLPKLFQPYYRARSATGIAGTGIGLNIVKQIVELHGGTVTVSSALGHGTTFTVALPQEGAASLTTPQAA
ncbi:ATP-binding protein (plasmid) [Rhizobium sullae]|uniref:histidine kinase n=1 Tax=Rhizobium sullae TaxID=50338 RepID=A0ABY5XSE6_RHISU|nr:ATP-binding protein [Rhizobium sullae]UWU16823.1 ATP-binding protein [Rhizobium sullae]